MNFILRTAQRAVLLLAVLIGTAHAAGQSETVTYYYTDPQGTVLATADATGNVTSTSDYRPYGSQAQGTPTQGPGYTGHVNDTDSGLVYMQARYYDPSAGRFLSIDPVAVKPGDLQSTGRFTYANNSPVLNIDPDGRQTLPPSVYQIDWQNPQTRQFVGDSAIAVTPVVGDVQNILDAVSDPTASNIGIAAIGLIPDVGGGAAKALKVSSETAKIGKATSKIDRTAFKAERSAF